MAKVDKTYQDLLREIISDGRMKGDRTGTGTLSIFDYTFKHNMEDGFPLLTTKKMFTKGVDTELTWFLSGSTNLRDLVAQGNNIWVGDAYKRYEKYAKSLEEPDMNVHVDDPKENKVRPLYKEEFIELIKTDDDFNDKWGDLGPIYGKQWVKWGEIGKLRMSDTNGNRYYGEYNQINQVQLLMDALEKNPDSRRLLVSAWNVAELDKMILPPCHWAYEFYTEELSREELNILYNKRRGIGGSDSGYAKGTILAKDPTIPTRRISLKWHQRSVDVPLGLPFNIASYAFLLEMVAQQVNMVPHMLVGTLTNVHIYKDQMDGVIEQLENNPDKYDAPKLVLNKAEDIFSYKHEDFIIEGYESYPTIKFPLSN